MVQGLVDRLVSVLRLALAAEIADVEDHVVAGPVSAPATADLPLIALTAGAIEFSTRGKDEGSSQPRPEQTRQTMRQVLADIQSGEFAKTFRGDYAKDFQWFKKQREADYNHPVEKIGRELRSMMPWLKPIEV